MKILPLGKVLSMYLDQPESIKKKLQTFVKRMMQAENWMDQQARAYELFDAIQDSTEK